MGRKYRRNQWCYVVVMSLLLIHLTSCNNYETTREITKEDYTKTKEFMTSDRSYGTHEAQKEQTNKAYSLSPNHMPLKKGDPLYISEHAGNEVSKVNGIASSFVVLVNNDAYVAVVTDNTATGIYSKGTMDDHDETNELYDATTGKEPLSAKALQNVALTVREVHPEVQQVYISSNRDFVNGITKLMRQYWLGNLMQEYEEYFNALVRNAFQ